jgi:D-galactarolactone cycloisomerase
MEIVSVEAIPIEAPVEAGDVYWGNQSWGYNKPANTASGGLLTHDDRTGYPPRWRSRAAYSTTIDTTIIKITTESGLVGWGEAKSPVAPTVTATIIRDLMADLLIGQDPTDRALQWDRMYGAMRIRGHSQGFWLEAMSGIDIALWDLTGKALGLPVSKLLGGNFRRRVKIYASGIPGMRADAPEEAWTGLREAAREVKRRGFHAVKVGIGLGIAGDLRTIETIREELGPNFIILTDAAGMYDLSQAITLARGLRRLGVGWLEAPLAPEAVADYGRAADRQRSRLQPLAGTGPAARRRGRCGSAGRLPGRRAYRVQTDRRAGGCLPQSGDAARQHRLGHPVRGQRSPGGDSAESIADGILVRREPARRSAPIHAVPD